MDEPRFTIFEPHIAESFGISRETLACIRKKFLVKGTDWDSVHKKVSYTAEAVEKIAALIKPHRGPEKIAPEDGASGAGSDVAAVSSNPSSFREGHRTSDVTASEELTEQSGNHSSGTRELLPPASAAPAPVVVPLPIAPAAAEFEMKVSRVTINRHIILAKNADGDEVRVRVKDSANFVPAMTVRARFLQAPDLFELVGRCPRQKGRW